MADPISVEAGLREKITAAIQKADDAFGYSLNLTRLVDGEETHTLTMPGFSPVYFSDRAAGYALIAERRNRARADAIIAALSASTIPDVREGSGSLKDYNQTDYEEGNGQS